MSGRYAHNHGVFTNTDPSPLDQRLLLQRYLDDAGYRTALVGKFLNGWPLRREPPHFDDFAMLAGGYYRSHWNINGDQRIVDAYQTSYVADQSRRVIRRAESQDQRPWFLYVAPLAPHWPYEIQRKYRNAPTGRFPSSPATEESDLSDKPQYVRDIATLVETDPDAIHAHWQGQLRLLMSADDMVEEIRQALATHGEERRTLAIFMSDNGYLWGEHGLIGKDVPYLPSARIPLYVRWPGEIRGGSIDARLVANIDLMPTVIDAVGGITPEVAPDGRSLLDPRWARDRLLLEHGGLRNDLFEIPPWASLVNSRGQYTEYHDADGSVMERELYSFESDPWQLDNALSGVEGSTSFTSSLSEQLARDRQCAGATCP